jgi:hypothetical protein
MTGETAGQDGIKEQAETLLDDANGAVDLVGSLEFGYLEANDQYADWHASTPLEPMVRALFLKELEDYSYSDLHRLVRDQDAVADTLGFDDPPVRTTFGRAWRDRFDDDLRQHISDEAEAVAEIAAEHGLSVGHQATEVDDKSGASQRTKDRYINEKIRDVTAEMQDLVFPSFDFKREENAHYADDAFLELQTHMGLTASAAESGTDLFAQDSDRDYAPDADTHLRTIQQLDPDDVLEMVDEGISRMADQASQHLSFARPVAVAIDMTYVAYFGERDELEMVMGAPKSKSYDWCHKFATLTVVGDSVKFTLAMRPVQKGDHVFEIVDDLVEQAREHVPIGTVYADAEFCAAGTFRVLNDANLDFVIPSPKNQRVKREIERMEHDIEVREDYGIYGPVPSGETQKRGVANLILLPSSADPEKTVAFTTNKDVSDETQNHRDFAELLVSQYSRRWGIENSYKTIKDFLAWTTSKNFTVRLFYFGFAVLLYDMWLLVDLLVQIALDVDRRNKPRVTAKRFLNLARKHLTGVG